MTEFGHEHACRPLCRLWKYSAICCARVRPLPPQFSTALDRCALSPSAFNQWRVTEEHRPLGEIMQVRRIYSASAKLRRTLNHQPQTEPANADEVLQDPV